MMTTRPSDGETLNAVHHALSSEYRRHVVQYLVDADDGVASVENLIHHLDHQPDIPGDRERIHVRLHHTALPKLAAMGFIDYDDRGVVRYREHALLEEELLRTEVMPVA